VIVQGILGGMTVLMALPPAVSSAHAAVGQAFFCLAVAMGLFTGRRWVGEEPRTEFDPRRPTLPALAWFSVAAIYVQLILGAMFRHHGMKLLPHLVMAGVVAVIVLWTVTRTLMRYAHIAALRRPANALLALLLAQLALGFLAYMTRIVWNANAAQPTAVMVASTVAHVSVGALLLASAVVLAIQSSRHVPVVQLGRAPTTGRAVTA
jgi:cytochrome c oxidase assembly protein subunit 15